MGALGSEVISHGSVFAFMICAPEAQILPANKPGTKEHAEEATYPSYREHASNKQYNTSEPVAAIPWGYCDD